MKSKIKTLYNLEDCLASEEAKKGDASRIFSRIHGLAAKIKSASSIVRDENGLFNPFYIVDYDVLSKSIPEVDEILSSMNERALRFLKNILRFDVYIIDRKKDTVAYIAEGHQGLIDSIEYRTSGLSKERPEFKKCLYILDIPDHDKVKDEDSIKIDKKREYISYLVADLKDVSEFVLYGASPIDIKQILFTTYDRVEKKEDNLLDKILVLDKESLDFFGLSLGASMYVLDKKNDSMFIIDIKPNSSPVTNFLPPVKASENFPELCRLEKDLSFDSRIKPKAKDNSNSGEMYA